MKKDKEENIALLNHENIPMRKWPLIQTNALIRKGKSLNDILVKTNL